ncbi:MAG: enolase C-terminal domain-like protein [Betaproteobacteria bacterium]
MSNTAILRLVLSQISIPFKVKFRHASAERTETSSIWVEAISSDGVTGYGESCPRPYVTGETIETAQGFFSRYQNKICNEIDSLSTMHQWMVKYQIELNANPAAWCAIELAILDMLAKQEGKTIESFLEISPLQGSYQYSAVLGDADVVSFKSSLAQYLHQGFTDFKVKLSGNLERDQVKIAEIRKCKNNALSVRVDANNLWSSSGEAIAYLRLLDFPFFAVEEPLKPNSYSELAVIAEVLHCKIILDESFLRIEQFAKLEQSPNSWLINLRVSKMGGLLRSLAIIESARTLGIALIVGAQVGETSLLTRAGLAAAQAARDILKAQEGAFGTHLLEKDICDLPLMFTKAGLLDCSKYPELNAPGFGITLSKKLDFISPTHSCTKNWSE